MSWVYRCVLTLVYATIIFAMSSSDSPPVSFSHHTDKIAHFAEFGIFCLLICWTLSSVNIRVQMFSKALMAIGITSIYGISDEFHQFFIPNRSVEIFDLFADMGGAFTAGALWYLFASRRRVHETQK